MPRTRLSRGLSSLVVALSLTMPAVAPALAAEADARPYVVVMAQEPIAAYDGGVSGLAATKVTPGRKVDPGSAAVGRYRAYLRREHNASLRQGGARMTSKLHDYSYALNGYAALLTPAQAEAIGAQKGVVRVMRDQMRHAHTDSSPAFLRLDADGGPYDQGIDGEGVVVGVIDSGIWPEHPSFADDGTYPEPAAPSDARPVRVREHRPQPERRCASPATTSSSAPARCWRRTARSWAPRRASSTRPATTPGTAPTRLRPPRATRASRRRCTACRWRPSPASRRAPTSSPTRASARRAASPPTWPPPSTRPWPTASTSSTTRSVAAPGCPPRTRSRSCSLPRPASSSRPRPATTDPTPRPSGARRPCRGSRASAPAPSAASTRAGSCSATTGATGARR